MAEEAARDYQSSLEELTFNSKLHINVLTMIAGENHENGYAADIVKVIEKRIEKAPSAQKLPVLYLMDSVMKNLRESQYTTLFSPNIGANFALVFEQVDEKKRQSMYKLRQTWNDIFPNNTLYALDCKINELDPAWPITAKKEEAVIIPGEAIEDQLAGTSDQSSSDGGLLSPSIHVNPKFIKKQQEAVRQKEEEEFRKELLIKQKEIEARKRKKEEEETRKKWEEEQERKMHDEIVAKQQEIMRLQQQKLELELEETRRNLRLREIELKRKEEIERIKEQEREKEHQRQIEEAKKEAMRKLEEERKEKERKEKERQENEKQEKERERKEKERIEEERKEKERREESRKSAVRSRDPRRAKDEAKKPKLNADPRSTPSPTKLDKTRRTDSPVLKADSPQIVDKNSNRNRKEKVPRRSANKIDRHYRRGHPSSSSESEEEKGLDIRPKRPRSRSPTRKRKLSPSGTEVRHKKSSSKSRVQKSSVAPESSKSENSPAPVEENTETTLESGEPASQIRAKKTKAESKKGDLLELFGKEDIDYRKLPPIPKRQANPDSMKSPSVGWTKFKQARPESFQFKQPRRMSFEGELRSPISSIRNALAEVGKEKQSNAEDILRYAELQRERGILSKEQHEDLLRQLAELCRLQKIREEVQRERRASTERKQMPLLEPPPKPPLLEPPPKPPLLSPASGSSGRKTLLPDPILPGRDAAMSLNFHDEARSPNAVDGGPKKPLLPPPVPPRALLDAPLRPREPLLKAPVDSRPPPLLADPVDVPRFMGPRFDRQRPMFPRGPRGPIRPLFADGPFGRMPDPRFNGPDQRFGPRGPRELLPAPPMDIDQQERPWYDTDEMYVPEYDQRWYRRVHFARDKRFIMTKFEVVINGKPYDISIRPDRKIERKIEIGKRPRMVRLDPDTFEIFIDKTVYYRMHEPERQVMIGGTKNRIYLRGPTEKMWIDGHQFEVRLDAPPESVLIANVSYDLIIDRQKKKVVVDGVPVCPWDADGVHEVFLGPNRSPHVFQFFAPSRRILIDGEECVLDLSKRFPAIKIKGQWHGIRFDGPPKTVFINDTPYTVHVDRPSKVRIHGRPYLLALGGPGHEVIIEDEWYEVKFGGPPVLAKIGGFKTFKVQLEGPPAEVKILGVVKSKEELESPRDFDPNSKDARGLDYAHPGPRGLQDMFREEQEFYPDGSPHRPVKGGMNAAESSLATKSGQGPPKHDNTNPLNVNELFSKLLSSGIIKKVDGVDSPAVQSPVPQPARDSPVTVTDQPTAPSVAGPAPIVIQPIPDMNTIEKTGETAMEVTEKKSKKEEEVASKTKVHYYKKVPWLADLDNAKMKVKYVDVIMCMYTGIQCTSCAARFRPEQQAEYKEHLDWHFRQNKRETQDSKVVRNRRWYYEITDWVQYEEIADVEERVVSNYFENMIQSIQSAIGAQSGPAAGVAPKGHDTCPVASGNDEENMCEICRDPFEQFYDDEEEEWHLRDAVRVDGRTYHPVCYEDFKEQLDNNDEESKGEKVEEGETAMEITESAGGNKEESVKSESSIKDSVKSEAPPKEAQVTAPAPIIDMISNPVAYLELLSKGAKQTNASLKATTVESRSSPVVLKEGPTEDKEQSVKNETVDEKEMDTNVCADTNSVNENSKTDKVTEMESSQVGNEQEPVVEEKS